jgi:ABC-type antimicrobial peptide transport system permease subunit
VVNSLDPALPFFQSGSLQEHMSFPLMPARIAASMLGAFGFLAVILAATGVYGTLAYAISRRTREIGIRVAIGATGGDVLKLVLRRSALILVCASFLGASLTLALGRFFSPILYGVSPRDPATYALALSLMALVGMFACLLPARRALRVQPAMALRED